MSACTTNREPRIVNHKQSGSLQTPLEENECIKSDALTIAEFLCRRRRSIRRPLLGWRFSHRSSAHDKAVSQTGWLLFLLPLLSAATSITADLESGGTLEHAQEIAADESPCTSPYQAPLADVLKAMHEPTGQATI